MKFFFLPILIMSLWVKLGVIAEESTFSVTVTILEFSRLSMQDINVESINPAPFTENDCYVSKNSGVLLAACNASTGYTVRVNAINQTDIVPDYGWKMTNLSTLDTLDFYLLADRDDLGNETPITSTGMMDSIPNEGTALIEDNIIINTPTQDLTEKNVIFHACIGQGQINKASYGTYTTTLKVTMITND
ncbi:MAG: hypothetical protein AAF443_00875 [Chlamydiota bacterium]